MRHVTSHGAPHLTLHGALHLNYHHLHLVQHVEGFAGEEALIVPVDCSQGHPRLDVCQGQLRAMDCEGAQSRKLLKSSKQTSSWFEPSWCGRKSSKQMRS